ncbi:MULTISPECIES: hypothetical protein [Thiomicrorhabdus]|uniref:Uncharacterized protein n=1 Tax=Thiomicrorhabdus heinhorstiae TaxID=2748010 RepID=A0ABS0BY26_9GAMM|nr:MULTISPECIES: hypothetical protein [Thiomicrorhabdus]MBF6058695.1 hypothetical protein [Thiomicrorhabdus heinhorstiae]
MANDPKQLDPNDLDSIDALLDEVSQKTDDTRETGKESGSASQDNKVSPTQEEVKQQEPTEEMPDQAAPQNNAAPAETEQVKAAAPVDSGKPEIKMPPSNAIDNPDPAASIAVPPEEALSEEPEPKMDLSSDALPKIADDSSDRLKEFVQSDNQPSFNKDKQSDSSLHGQRYEVISKKAAFAFLSTIVVLLILLLTMGVSIIWMLLANPSSNDQESQIQQAIAKQALAVEENSAFLQRLDKKVDEIYVQLEQMNSDKENAEKISVDLLSEKQAQESSKQADTKIDSEEYRSIQAELKSLKAILNAQNRRLSIMVDQSKRTVTDNGVQSRNDMQLKRLIEIERRLLLIEKGMNALTQSLNTQAADKDTYQYKGPKPPKFYEDKVMDSYP